MNYTKQSFDRCFFNPLEKDLFKSYPKLKELEPPEIAEDDPLASEGEQLFKYVIALYDPKSPLIKDNPDLNQRKIAAAEIAGYSDNGKLDIIFSCGSDYLVALIVGYLRNVVQSRLWASIQADEQVFWEFVARLHKPIAEESDKDGVSAIEKKIKLSQGRETISSQIEVNWNKFFSDDEDLKKKVRKHDYSPEAMAGVGKYV
jgi:hypothetical protein